MNSLIFVMLLCPLIVGWALTILGLDKILFMNSLEVNEHVWIILTMVTMLSAVTAYLVSWRFAAAVTFQWLFFCGLGCLILALVEAFYVHFPVLSEYSASIDYLAVEQLLLLATTIVLGIAFFIAALIQDRGRSQGKILPSVPIS